MREAKEANGKGRKLEEREREKKGLYSASYCSNNSASYCLGAHMYPAYCTSFRLLQPSCKVGSVICSRFAVEEGEDTEAQGG